MATDSEREKIEEWVAAAPECRVVETTRTGDTWQTQALEDGEVRYEETDFGGDEPLLTLLAAWCERQSAREARPLVKTSGDDVFANAQKLRG